MRGFLVLAALALLVPTATGAPPARCDGPSCSAPQTVRPVVTNGPAMIQGVGLLRSCAPLSERPVVRAVVVVADKVLHPLRTIRERPRLFGRCR